MRDTREMHQFSDPYGVESTAATTSTTTSTTDGFKKRPWAWLYYICSWESFLALCHKESWIIFVHEPAESL